MMLAQFGEDANTGGVYFFVEKYICVEYNTFAKHGDVKVSTGVSKQDKRAEVGQSSLKMTR